MAVKNIVGVDIDKTIQPPKNSLTQKNAFSKEISKVYVPLRKGLYADFKKICAEKNVSVYATITQLIICVIATETNRDLDDIVKKEREFYLQMREYFTEQRRENKRAKTRKNAAEKQLVEAKPFKMTKKARNLISTNPYDGSDVYEMLTKKK